MLRKVLSVGVLASVMAAMELPTDDASLMEMARSKGRSTEKWGVSDWDAKHTHVDGGLTVTTYTSPAIRLKTGAAHFTFNPITHMPFPTGDYAVVGVEFSIVDEHGAQSPLSEMYNHHWLIGTHTELDPMKACEGDMFWGAGAEMRGICSGRFPKGYGNKRIAATGTCGANVHFIRTDDLATVWKGFNDPMGDIGAATKNCIECGFAPGRAPECLPGQDGVLTCCQTGSRCPVNHPEDHTAKVFHLVYNMSWTRDMAQVKQLTGGVLDVTNGLIEWNAEAEANNVTQHQKCTDDECTVTGTFVVGEQQYFGRNSICAGRMMNSYMHQHIGGINGTMAINGQEVCTSSAIYGTDPKNAPGNEMGYVVNNTRCIDHDNLHNSVVLKKGDELTVTVNYDVNPASTRSHPMPGGKHGGVMGLFFYTIECDDGTFNEEYACRQGQCVAVPAGSETELKKPKGEYATRGECEQHCAA
jgi:hypothetical protein